MIDAICSLLKMLCIKCVLYKICPDCKYQICSDFIIYVLTDDICSLLNMFCIKCVFYKICSDCQYRNLTWCFLCENFVGRSSLSNFADTKEFAASHIWMSHVTHMNVSCHTYEWVMAHIWMSHVTHMNESCHTYEWVMSHIWMSHVTHMNESCHTYEIDSLLHLSTRYFTTR